VIEASGFPEAHRIQTMDLRLNNPDTNG